MACLPEDVADVKFNDSTETTHSREVLRNLTENPLGDSKSVFRCKLKDVAVKKMPLDSATDSQEEWEKLIALKNEHILSYHQCILDGSIR